MVRFLFLMLFLSANILEAQVVFPYLEIENDADFEKVSIEKSSTTINLQTVLATISSHQTYVNTSAEPIKIKYIVPLSSDQNVYQLIIKNGSQKIELKAESIVEIRKEAQRKQQKLTTNANASQRMQIELFDLEPNAELQVEIKWTKIVSVKNNQYQFDFPAVIAKRTKSFTETKRFPFPVELYQPQNFDLNLHLLGNNMNEIQGLPKKFTRKQIEPNYLNLKSLEYISNSISLKYNYLTDKINADVLHYRDGNCLYILGNIHPPKNIDETKLKPREYIFLLDTSGSMRGFALESLRKMMLEVIQELQPYEKFNIHYFNRNANQFAARSVFATEENKKRAIEMLQKMEGSGNMKLNEALKKVNNIPTDFSFNRLIVIASDGRIDPHQNIHLDIKSNLKNAQYFVLGIGQQVDYKTMNFIGYTTGIQPLIIENEQQIEQKLAEFRTLILTPLLRNIEVKSTTVDLGETFPRNFNGFLSNQSLNFITKDCQNRTEKSLKIMGKDGDLEYEKSFDLRHSQQDFAEALKFYWAKNKIEYLMMEEERCGEYCRKTGRYRKEIEEIGKTYNIATPYTILVEKRVESAQQTEQNTITFHYDYDTDGDGVNDLEDQCPNVFGAKSANGCPIEKLSTEQQKMAIENLTNQSLKSIKFDFDSDEIRTEDLKVLNEIIVLIKSYPSYHFQIIGHTDTAGTTTYNLDLSNRRANAVLDYLVSKGIGKSRLTAVGKGDKNLLHTECRPIEVCPEWKNFENRRVQVLIQ